MTSMSKMLSFDNVELFYDHVYALKGVSIDLNEGETVALIGANGAGKSSILRAITGLRKIRSGAITYMGERLDGTPAADIVRKGIAMVPEGRRVFPLMSVKDNLLMGAFTRADRAEIARTLESVLTRFPRLRERYSQQASTLSGGEQQMMVIGRALMARPKLLLLDEPSLGIAPKLVQDIARAIVAISRDEKVSVLLVEQNSRMALSISNRAYALSTGQVVLQGNSKDLLNPNTTASMTEKIAAAARRAAAPGTKIVARNPDRGPASIEGFYDEAMSLSGVLAVIRTTPDVDAVVIACFDDTGLDAARCLTDRPVVGIGEAAYHMASMISNKFSVVTTLARSVPALEHNLHRYGLAARCARVRSSEVAVLELEEPGSNAAARISEEIARAIAEDRAEAIVLGCAGMTDLTDRLAAAHGLPVLDGVSCAVTLVEAMVRLRLRTSRLGGYAPVPVQKLAYA